MQLAHLEEELALPLAALGLQDGGGPQRLAPDGLVEGLEQHVAHHLPRAHLEADRLVAGR